MCRYLTDTLGDMWQLCCQICEQYVRQIKTGPNSMSYLMMLLTENFQNIWPVFLRNDLKLSLDVRNFWLQLYLISTFILTGAHFGNMTIKLLSTRVTVMQNRYFHDIML